MLEQLHTDVTARRKTVAAQRDSAQKRHAAAVRRLTRAQDRYRATLRGIAESLRSIEAALLSGESPATIRNLQARHVMAEEDSKSEYEQRANRWGHSPGDGPVRACPAGNGPLATRAIDDRVLASYRHDPTVNITEVHLFRLDDRRKVVIRVPTAESSTISAVLTHALRDPQIRTKVTARLELDLDTYIRLSSPHTPNVGG